MICEGELFAETAGGDFTPHVVNVFTGEVILLHSTSYRYGYDNYFVCSLASQNQEFIFDSMLLN